MSSRGKARLQRGTGHVRRRLVTPEKQGRQRRCPQGRWRAEGRSSKAGEVGDV